MHFISIVPIFLPLQEHCRLFGREAEEEATNRKIFLLGLRLILLDDETC